MSENYCADCGNTGFLPDGDPCKCGYILRTELESVTCLTVPEEYRDIRYDPEAVNPDCGAGYAKYLSEVCDDILRKESTRHKNLFISSPMKRSKTVFAYTCIQQLFRRGVPVFPLFDTGEIWNIMQSLDLGKKSVYLEGLDIDPAALYTTPVLFVRVSDNISFTVFDAMIQLLSRRCQRGNGTIFLSSNRWSYLVTADNRNRVSQLAGDGYFGTIKVKDFTNYTGGDASES